MLVCHISARPRGSVVAADIAETLAAVDSATTGQVVFATLVDDPASVSETVDAYLGEIMFEAASAGDSADAGLNYDSALIETTTAASLQDGSIATVLFASFDGTASNVTLSGGNLTAVAASTSTGGARSAAQKTSGKYYFEISIPVIVEGCQNALGVVTATGTYTDMWNNGTNSSEVLCNSGSIFSNNGWSGLGIGAPADNDIISAAIDLDNRKSWFRKNGGNWNNDASHNPATNVGGATIAATVSFAPAVAFGNLHAVGDTFTLNCGQSAFSYAAPSGFTNWPAS